VAAGATVARGGAWGPRVGRESQRQEEGYPHGHRRCRYLRHLLVPDTGETRPLPLQSNSMAMK